MSGRTRARASDRAPVRMVAAWLVARAQALCRSRSAEAAAEVGSEAISGKKEESVAGGPLSPFDI